VKQLDVVYRCPNESPNGELHAKVRVKVTGSGNFPTFLKDWPGVSDIQNAGAFCKTCGCSPVAFVLDREVAA
jgi:hypothetical protein